MEAARMRRKKVKPNYRKTILRLPDLDHSKSSVLNSLSSPGSRRAYGFAIDQFIAWYCAEPRLALHRAVVLRFRLHLESLGLAAATINQRLAAVRRLAYEAADSGLLSPELAAGIRRVKGVKQLGSRSGNWLNLEQAHLLLENSNGDSLRNKRDLAMMAILLGCGLRRAELATLNVEDIQIRQGALGDCRSDRQGRSHPDGSHAALGQERSNQMDRSRQAYRWQGFPRCQQAWHSLGLGCHGKCGLVRRSRLLETHRA